MLVRRFVISTVPPTVNQQKTVGTPRGQRKARMMKTKEFLAWIEFTKIELIKQPGFLDGPFLWRSEILFPCNVSKADVDNIPKAVHDVLVSMKKVPDDRYLVDSRIRWATGNNIIVAIQKEELDKWTKIKRLSKSLIKKLAK